MWKLFRKQTEGEKKLYKYIADREFIVQRIKMCGGGYDRYSDPGFYGHMILKIEPWNGRGCRLYKSNWSDNGVLKYRIKLDYWNQKPDIFGCSADENTYSVDFDTENDMKLFLSDVMKRI